MPRTPLSLLALDELQVDADHSRMAEAATERKKPKEQEILATESDIGISKM